MQIYYLHMIFSLITSWKMLWRFVLLSEELTWTTVTRLMLWTKKMCRTAANTCKCHYCSINLRAADMLVTELRLASALNRHRVMSCFQQRSMGHMPINQRMVIQRRTQTTIRTDWLASLICTRTAPGLSVTPPASISSTHSWKGKCHHLFTYFQISELASQNGTVL